MTGHRLHFPVRFEILDPRIVMPSDDKMPSQDSIDMKMIGHQVLSLPEILDPRITMASEEKRCEVLEESGCPLNEVSYINLDQCLDQFLINITNADTQTRPRLAEILDPQIVMASEEMSRPDLEVSGFLDDQSDVT